MSERIEVKQLSAIGNEVGEITAGTLHDVSISPPEGHIFAKDMRIEFGVQTPTGIEWRDLPIKEMSLDWVPTKPTVDGVVSGVMFGVAPWLQEYIPNPTLTWSITATTSWWPRVSLSPSLPTLARRLRTSYPGLKPDQAQRLARYARSRGVV